MDVPLDIQKMIEKYFNESECADAKAFIRNYLSQNHPILIQSSRAVIYLSDGDLDKMKRLASYEIDPRDLIVMGDEKAGNPKDYFRTPFEY